MMVIRMTLISNSQRLFPANLEEAQAAQREMAEQVLFQDSLKKPIQTVAGMDVSNTPFDPECKIFASAVVLSYDFLQPLETSAQVSVQKFPYIPGFLGFREVPALVQAYQKLDVRPDVILVDGHGASHPRGLGVASHLGVVLDIPTIGVAKSSLVGKLKEPLEEDAGSMTPLVWKGKEIGMVLRTKKRCSPLIISPGHKVTLETALEIVKHCLKGYRLPEPTRQAHLAANSCRIEYNAASTSTL